MRQKKRNKRLEHNFRWIKTKIGHTKIDDNIPWKRAKHIDGEFSCMIFYLENPVLGKKEKEKSRKKLAGDTRLARQVAKLYMYV